MPWYGWLALAGAFLIILWNGLHHYFGVWPLSLALCMAATGDFCLATSHGRISIYLLGVASFSLTHVFYGWHAFRSGPMDYKTALTTFLISTIIIFIGVWYNAMSAVAMPLKIGGSLYLIITCLDLGTAVGRHPRNLAALFCGLGVAALLISDIFLVYNQFLHYSWSKGLCIPFYASSSVFATISGFFTVKEPPKEPFPKV